MPLDDLQATIEKLQDKIETHRPYFSGNETATRQVLIDPLLLVLGWDVSDPEQVALEYAAGGGRADYALISNDGPVAVIEAKNLDIPLQQNDIMQTLNYANSRGIKYMAITNGDNWFLYDVFSQQPIEERIIMQFSITQIAAHESALQALRMWRSNLASARPVPACGPVLQPDATEQPFEFDDRSDPPISSPVAEPDTDLGWTSLTNLSDVEKNRPKPKCIKFPDGCTERFRASSVGVLREIAKWLVDNGMLTPENAQVGYPEYPNFYFSNIGPGPRHLDKDFSKPEEILDSGIYIEKNWTGQDCIVGAKALLEHCEVDPSTIQVSFE